MTSLTRREKSVKEAALQRLKAKQEEANSQLSGAEARYGLNAFLRSDIF